MSAFSPKTVLIEKNKVNHVKWYELNRTEMKKTFLVAQKIMVVVQIFKCFWCWLEFWRGVGGGEMKGNKFICTWRAEHANWHNIQKAEFGNLPRFAEFAESIIAHYSANPHSAAKRLTILTPSIPGHARKYIPKIFFYAANFPKVTCLTKIFCSVYSSYMIFGRII